MSIALGMISIAIHFVVFVPVDISVQALAFEYASILLLSHRIVCLLFTFLTYFQIVFPSFILYVAM